VLACLDGQIHFDDGVHQVARQLRLLELHGVQFETHFDLDGFHVVVLLQLVVLLFEEGFVGFV